jgi:sugar phosphate isomerase/epimerase
MPVLKQKDWLISSLDEDNRRQGIRMVKRSINLAHQLGAPRIILHAGQIQGMGNLERKIHNLYRSGKGKSSEFNQLFKEAKKFKDKTIQPHLEAAFTSLQELVEYAKPYSTQIGIENRYHYMDIPGIDEMQALLSVANPAQLGFIFDVGHAMAMDHLGFYQFEEWLKRYSSRIIGVHLHDVNGFWSHCVLSSKGCLPHARGQGEQYPGTNYSRDETTSREWDRDESVRQGLGFLMIKELCICQVYLKNDKTNSSN